MWRITKDFFLALLMGLVNINFWISLLLLSLVLLFVFASTMRTNYDVHINATQQAYSITTTPMPLMLTPTPTSMLTPTPTSMLTPTPTSMLTPPSGYADEGEYQQGEEFQNTEKSLAQILAPYIAVCVLIVISYSFGKLSRPSFAKIKEAHFSSIDEVQTSVPSNTIYNILSQTLDKLKGGSDGSKHHGNSIFSKISHLLLSQVEVFIVQRWDIDINKLENADLLRKTRNAFEEEKRSVRIKAYLIIIALLSFLWFLNDGSFEALIAAIVSWAAVFGFKS